MPPAADATAPQPIPLQLPLSTSPSTPSVIARVFKSLLVSLLVLSVLFNIYIAILLGVHLQNIPLMEEIEYLPGNAQQKIALIDVQGMLNMPAAEEFRTALQQATADEAVKGVILVINSPGGAVAPSAMMHRYVQQFVAEQRALARGQRDDSDEGSSDTGYEAKKLYAVIQQVGASGAYWTAAAVPRIYAQEDAVVGSIGVIYVNLVLEQVLNEKLGITPIVVKSSRSPYKDKGSPFRMPTEPEKVEIRQDLDAIHSRFVQAVQAGRQLSDDKAWALANGDVYDGSEARKNRLIDRVGFLEDAIDDMTDALQLDDPLVVRYARPKGLAERLTGVQTDLAANLDIRQQIEEFATTPRVQALWLGR